MPLQEAHADLEQLLDFRHDALVDDEYDDVIFGLDHRVVVRVLDLVAAGNCGNGR